MFGVYLRVRILTFFVIKVLKEVLLKKTKTIFAHIPFVISSFCDGYPMVLPLPYLPHLSVIFRYSYTNVVCTNKKASGLIF